MKKLSELCIILFLVTFNLACAQSSLNSTEKNSVDKLSELATLKSHFHQYVDNGTLAGTSILLYQNGKITKDLYGKQSIASNIPMSENTIFRLASMTKPITSVAIMMLVEEGKLSLDDPAEKYIPSFKKLQVYQDKNTNIKPKNLLTIRHLLSHTGGVSSAYDASPAGQLCAQKMQEQKPTSLSGIIENLSTLPLAFHPGEGWAYSYSTDILAYIVEQVTEVPIDQFLNKRIFEPLKMMDTGFQVPAEKIHRFATLYTFDKTENLIVRDHPEKSPFTDGTYFPRGNGGLTSTINDYFRFTKMILNGGELDGVRILKKSTLDLMTKNIVPDEHLPIRVAGNPLPDYGFGLGFGVLVGEPSFGEAGDLFWPGSAFTYFFINPKKEAIGLFMTQLSDMRKMHLIGEFHGLASAVFD